MMDPITAVGFAASILNLIDYAHKVVTGAVEVFKSGSTSKNVHISEIIGDLEDAAEELRKWPPGKSKHEKALHQLSAPCQELAQRLINLLARLSTTPGKSKWMSVRVVLRSMRKDVEIEELEKILDKYRSQILLRLIQIVSDQQLKLQVELCDFRTQSRDQTTNTLDELKSLRTGLLDAIESSVRDSKMEEQSQQTPLLKPQDYEKSYPDSCPTSGSLDDQLARIDELRRALDQILAKKDTPTPEMRILQQLWFDDMYAREDQIHQAEGNTFEWILEDGQPDENLTQDLDQDLVRSVRSQEEDDDDEQGGDDDEEEEEEDENDEDDEELDVNEDEDGDNGYEESSGSSSISSSSRWSLDTEALNSRTHTRSRFQDWLKNGKNVFHISGKAGSGKSTLMKLIVADQRTHKFLDDWSGEKRLISAQFFFWRGGSGLQRSRQGLYRSLLFEILKQCPHLIRDVFPETHRAFEKKSRENSIDQLFFRPEHIETAFRKLVSLPSSSGYRICIFIDGLDEYGDESVDSYEYEKLAKSLAIWAENDDIKILATSRPHGEFLDAFPENLRIHLHEVNAHDIQSFSRHMFETDDQFELIKGLYVDLVENIVDYSAGVFLWARLVVRSLIASIHRRDPVDSLHAQLIVVPRDLNKLYEHFFDSISRADQERAFKMLLLVAHKSAFRMNLFNALFLSWLDHLDNPNFPTAYDMKPYTDEEIRSKHETVRRQISGLTHGLLEMTTYSEPLFSSKLIQFFHRTARDFVLENAYLQKFHAESPDLTSRDTYLRLEIAELWFSRPGAVSGSTVSRWGFRHQEISDPKLLPALAKARTYHNSNSSPWTFRGYKFNFPHLFSRADSSLSPVPESQLHYIISHFHASEYIKFVASQGRQLLDERDGLSCLLSACFSRLNWDICLENVRCLLNLEVSPMALVLVHYEDPLDEEEIPPDARESNVTVWSVFLLYLVQECFWSFVKARKGFPNRLQEIWDVVELLLKYGGYGNSLFLFAYSENPSVPAFVIPLRELICQWKPRNQEALLQLIDKDVPSSFRSRLKKWRSIRQRSSETPFDPAQYKPFHISMLDATENGGRSIYDLYSVWSAGCETKFRGLTVRIY